MVGSSISTSAARSRRLLGPCPTVVCAGEGVDDGVGEQVVDRLPQPVGIAGNREAVRSFDDDVDVTLVGEGSVSAGRHGHHVGEVDGAGAQERFVALGAASSGGPRPAGRPLGLAGGRGDRLAQIVRATSRSRREFELGPKVARGVRGSWPASATKPRSWARAPRRRSRRPFIVVASAAISSRVAGTARWVPSSCSPRSAVSRRMRSTSRRTAPASHQAASPATRTVGGPRKRKPFSTCSSAESEMSVSVPVTRSTPSSAGEAVAFVSSEGQPGYGPGQADQPGARAHRGT